MAMEKSLPVWGGIECTINRVGDTYHDQLEFAGHYSRPGDIDAIAALGITMFRYPVLWERYQPAIDTDIDWSFARSGIESLLNRGITPIVGLVHHGSGPSFVNFFDGSFESGLAEYAGQVALAFPEVSYYTPVNEPLTTARFCGLYGHWYPHRRDDNSFCRILLSECRATVMAMEAIRQISPRAKLVVTDDLGKTYATALLSYQAEFENERRWLSYDLISGKISETHPMWSYLLWSGIAASDLHWFLDHHCPIDIIGLNYYITSERYLDEDKDRYPPHTHGGNGRHAYADIEVVRVPGEHQTGFEILVKEAWARFTLPLAITEVHIHCTREEQLRWFSYIYESSRSLVAAGIPIKGVTCWAMLGASGWDKLLTEGRGTCEPGAFRLAGNKLQPTALATLVLELCRGKRSSHPVLKTRGWWQSSCRFLHSFGSPVEDIPGSVSVAPLLIIGARGTLGQAFVRGCSERNIHALQITRSELDVTDVKQIEAVLQEHNPWAVINCSGYVLVDEAEINPDRCYAVNTQGVVNLATLCAGARIGLVNFSSDLVFNGRKKTCYTESDPADPKNVYGMSKALAEQALKSFYPESLIVRTSAFFGPHDRYNFAYAVTDAVRSRYRFRAANDIYVSPTYVPDLVNCTLDLLIDGEGGIRHVCNEGMVSWSEFAIMVCESAGLDTGLIDAVPASQLGLIAKRPVNSAMRSDHGCTLVGLEAAVQRFTAANAYLHESALSSMVS